MPPVTFNTKPGSFKLQPTLKPGRKKKTKYGSSGCLKPVNARKIKGRN